MNIMFVYRAVTPQPCTVSKIRFCELDIVDTVILLMNIVLICFFFLQEKMKHLILGPDTF